jgi:hypothetical protein
MERNAVALIRYKQHLGSEGSADELAAHAVSTFVGVFAVLLCGDLFEHLRYCGTVLGVEVCVDFVEEVERRRVTLLNCEDECEGTETWVSISGLIERESRGNELFWPPESC